MFLRHLIICFLMHVNHLLVAVCILGVMWVSYQSYESIVHRTIEKMFSNSTLLYRDEERWQCGPIYLDRVYHHGFMMLSRPHTPPRLVIDFDKSNQLLQSYESCRFLPPVSRRYGWYVRVGKSTPSSLYRVVIVLSDTQAVLFQEKPHALIESFAFIFSPPKPIFPFEEWISQHVTINETHFRSDDVFMWSNTIFVHPNRHKIEF